MANEKNNPNKKSDNSGMGKFGRQVPTPSKTIKPSPPKPPKDK